MLQVLRLRCFARWMVWSCHPERFYPWRSAIRQGVCLVEANIGALLLGEKSLPADVSFHMTLSLHSLCALLPPCLIHCCALAYIRCVSSSFFVKVPRGGSWRYAVRAQERAAWHPRRYAHERVRWPFASFPLHSRNAIANQVFWFLLDAQELVVYAHVVACAGSRRGLCTKNT